MQSARLILTVAHTINDHLVIERYDVTDRVLTEMWYGSRSREQVVEDLTAQMENHYTHLVDYDFAIEGGNPTLIQPLPPKF